jgi:hypothetical protein
MERSIKLSAMIHLDPKVFVALDDLALVNLKQTQFVNPTIPSLPSQIKPKKRRKKNNR